MLWKTWPYFYFYYYFLWTTFYIIFLNMCCIFPCVLQQVVHFYTPVSASIHPPVCLSVPSLYNNFKTFWRDSNMENRYILTFWHWYLAINDLFFILALTALGNFLQEKTYTPGKFILMNRSFLFLVVSIFQRQIASKYMWCMVGCVLYEIWEII